MKQRITGSVWKNDRLLLRERQAWAERLGQIRLVIIRMN